MTGLEERLQMIHGGVGPFLLNVFFSFLKFNLKLKATGHTPSFHPLVSTTVSLFFFLLLFEPTPGPYEGSQARGQI